MTSETTEMKVVFDDIKLQVTKCYPEPEIFNQLMLEINSTPAIYSFHRHEKFEQNLSIGAMNFNQIVFRERVPETVLVFFVYTDALLGKYNKNPLEFPNLDVSKVKKNEYLCVCVYVCVYIFILFRCIYNAKVSPTHSILTNHSNGILVLRKHRFAGNIWNCYVLAGN